VNNKLSKKGTSDALSQKKEKGIEQEKKCDVALVPLVGQYGFR